MEHQHKSTDLRNHEPATIDSGDQMPCESTWWGNAEGRQHREPEPRKERWLYTVMRWLRREPRVGSSPTP